MGISTSRLCDRRAYRGRIDGEYRMRAPSVASRSRTHGWRTATGPMPVMISRSGRWPWRTTRCWPVSVLRSVCFARNSATSASTAWVSSARAPLRRISVRQSVKAPGWASLMTLLSDTAYHSFIGEVEALNTTTIRRLTRSRRHQLLAIALVDPALNVRVVHVGEVLQGLVAAMMKRPSPDCPADGLQRLWAGGGHEAMRVDMPLPHRFPCSETEAEKVERLVREVATPVRIFAVDDFCLLRMQHQLARRKAVGKRA